MSTENSNPHALHRQRLKARFLKGEFEGFSDHEVLELLLCYALPRKDTNVLGHELIARFGSLSQVLEADFEDLCSFCGLSEHSALLLRMIPSLSKRYLTDREKDTADYGDYDVMGQYLVRRYIGLCHEECNAVLLDNGYRILDYTKVGDGVVNASPIHIRKIAAAALQKNATFVVLSHNHPAGTPIPSGDDLNVTRAVQSALTLLGIRFLEHYIVAGDQYIGIQKGRIGTFTP